MAPLASSLLGLLGLFRGTGETEIPELPVYDPPAPRRLERVNGSQRPSELGQAVWGERGDVRSVPALPPQVVVNVSAMDSRSFLDHSNDIATAVRDAMLHMHPVNDVIGEL